MSTPKLTESSKAALLLQKKFQNSEVSATDNAKALRKSDTIFIKRKLDNSMTKYIHNKEKKGRNVGIVLNVFVLVGNINIRTVF